MRYSLYFAYGSNMQEPQFKERCPSSHFLCRAALPAHRFVITTRGYASVEPQSGDEVQGVLCAITESDEWELDRREGVHENIYRREHLAVVTEFGYAMRALLYIDHVKEPGVPKKGYLEKILAGAERHQLPAAYVAEIKAWAKKSGESVPAFLKRLAGKHTPTRATGRR